jgi:Arc/MetJ family transcription regulator
MPYISAVKITVEIDEKKLSRLMKLTGIRTKTQALDYALSTAERSTRRDHLLARPLKAKNLKDAVYPSYDIRKLREREIPSRG